MRHILALILAFAALPLSAADYAFRLKNSLGFTRVGETVEVGVPEGTDLAACCLRDEDGGDVPFEAVEGTVIRFRATVPHGATRGYVLTDGEPASPDKLTYAVIKMPTSRADIAWENDLAAYRMYSSVLLKNEPNTGNGVDLWQKKQAGNVIDAMYGLSNYHNESLYGVDAFSVNGRRLGAGGVTHVTGEKLQIHNPHDACEILENGLLGSSFLLTYNNVDVDGDKYTKTLRVTSTAGSLLNKAVVRYEGPQKTIRLAVALYQHTDMSNLKVDGQAFMADGVAGWAENPSEGTVSSAGARFYQGCYVPGGNTKTEVIDHHLCVTVDYTPGTDLEFYFGGGWNVFPAGTYTCDEDWFDALDRFRRQVENPLVLTTVENLPQKNDVIEILNKVNAIWQQRHATHGDYFWNRAVYHIGNMAAYNVTGDRQYLDYSVAWAEKNNYRGATGTDKTKWQYATYGEGADWVLFGDNQVCFQIYADLYNLDPEKDPRKIERALEVMGYEISTDNDDYLWWVDGLFMVMPIMTKLYHITGDATYLEKMYRYWRWSTDLMCDEATGLYFRDTKYIYPQHTTNAGFKDFWARGDGWIFAAFATVLSELPADDPHREEYVRYYRRMAAAIRDCQQPEGYWTRSMLDPSYAPGRETSGTALFCYGYAWGINNGILSEVEYGTTLERAWNYLSTVALQPDGTVGYIQPIGEKADPNQTLSATSYYDFGVGAYLLAAAEISRYAAGEQMPIILRIASVELSDVNRITLKFNTMPDAGENITYRLDGEPFTGHVDYDGDRTVVLTLPRPLPYGRHTIAAAGSERIFVNPVPLTANTTIKSVTAIGAQQGNPATGTIDNNLTTRWSQEGKGQWIQFDLGEVQTVYAVDLAFYLGDTRVNYFDIQTGADTKQWTTVCEGLQSSGLTTQLERFALPEEQSARYVRVVCNGASTTTWNSITEARVRILDSTIRDVEVPMHVHSDILLPQNTPGGTPLVWMSDNPDAMTGDGRVHLTEDEQTVTLTAVAGDAEVAFPVTLLPRQPERTLQLHYTFEAEDVYTDGSQKMLTDHSSYHRDAKLMGRKCTIDGTLNLSENTASAFSTNGYVLVPGHLLDSLRSYTVMFTATPAALARMPRFYDFGSSSANSMFLRAGDFAAGFKYNGETTALIPAGTLVAGTTYRLAVTFDAMTGVTLVYVDGCQVARSQQIVHEPYELTRIAADTRNYIGRTQWWSSNVKDDNVDYVGTMDDLRVYGMALSADEMAQVETGMGDVIASDVRQENDAVYDLMGRKVADSAGQSLRWKKGIYIKNGRKVICR